jgi:hypothetical protein
LSLSVLPKKADLTEEEGVKERVSNKISQGSQRKQTEIEGKSGCIEIKI